jgi:predicted membrane-bound spermidine synthase
MPSAPLIRDSLRLPLAFFASGAAALLFEVLWFRALGRVLGNTVWAGALVLTAFMLGIALGGILAARWAGRVRRPALAFAAAEITVALSGGILVWGLPAAEPMIAEWLAPLVGHPAALSAARLALALGAMLVPTTAMGTTLALGVRVLGQRETARALGTLYAANTFGACVAPLVAEYYLIGALGLSGTALVAAALDLVAAGLASLGTASAEPEALAPRGDGASPARLLTAAALAGGLALALEVVWFRLLLLYAPGTDTAFATMLALLLAGIAAGGALAPRLARFPFAWVAGLCSLAVVLGYALTLPARSGVADMVRCAIPLMLPAAVLSGALFTLLGAQLRSGSDDPQAPIGRLVSANTLGGACGAALAGFALLPHLGIEASLFILAAGYALLPLIFIEPRTVWKPVLPAAIAAAGLALFPVGDIKAHLAQAARVYQSLEGSSVVSVTQGPTLTLQLLRRDYLGEPISWRLLTDNYSMTGTDLWGLRYMQLFAWLPLSLHPSPQRALLISYGAGNTARALLDEPELEALTIVDVSPEILAASRTIHGARDPLLDKRASVVLEDGRYYLRTRSERFDLITGEPPPPAMAGVVNLYTFEYFAALAARLAPGGLATYWLPVNQLEVRGARAVVAAFCQAFPDCSLWAGSSFQWILMGGRDFQARPGLARFARLWRDARGPRLAASALEHPEQMGAAFLADAAQLRSWYGAAPPLDDDHPKRIAADFSAAHDVTEYARWLEPQGARRRFESSAWIAAHFPAELVRAGGPYFADQPAINGDFDADPAKNLKLADELLRKTDLRVPVLWMLASGVTEQEILSRRLRSAGSGERDRPDYAYAMGVRALADRDYAQAATLFARAADQHLEPAGALAAYAWCRAGRVKQAANVPGAERLAPELRCWERR